MNAKEKIEHALAFAEANSSKSNGFPFFAECLSMAGARHVIWSLPATQSAYIMDSGEGVVRQGVPLFIGVEEVPRFNQEAVIDALRAHLAGESSFREFLQALWVSGAWGYDVDFNKRTVTFMGSRGELHTESYPPVTASGLSF